MKYLKIILFNLTVLFILILIVEKSIPYFTDIDIGSRRYLIIQEYQPNSKLGYMFNDTIYNKTIDQNGFTIDPDHFSDTYSKTIFFLGSSNVETLYIEEGKRLADLTAKKINLFSEHKFNAFNIGKSGLNSSHVLINLISNVIPRKPDYVFLMPSNDFTYLTNYGSFSNGPKKHFTELNFYNTLKNLKDLFIPNLYILLKSSFEFQVPDFAVDNDLKINSFDNLKDTDLKEFENYFRSIIRLCSIFDIEVIVGTQFYNLEALETDGVVKANFINKKINSLVKKISEEESSILLNLDSLVPKNYKYMYDGGHLNNLGVDLVSDLISEEILKIEQND
jgi:lysophospholipase L1-like esterase